MPNVINYYATRTDIVAILEDFERKFNVHYAAAGSYDTPHIAQYATIGAIPEAGRMSADAAHKGKKYLIALEATTFSSVEIQQRDGGLRYAVDQRANPNTVVLAPGGAFDDKTILAGSLGTTNSSPVSMQLMRTLGRLLRSQWSAIQSYYVGPEAEAILDMGGRLTAIVGMPGEYDLVRP